MARTQSSLAATCDGERWVLLNASPDLSHQLRVVPDLWPREPGRNSPIAAVVLTNADVDHVAGLLSLRERHPFRLLALAPIHATLGANPIFEVLADGIVERVTARPDEALDIAGVRIALFPVPGKAPLYREGPAPMIGDESGETAGASVRAGSTAMAYIPCCAEIGPSVLDKAREADILLFDGTVFTDDEMIAAGVGEKTGRRMGHVPISGEGGSLARLAGLPCRRKLFVHINNTNPILVEGSPERREVERAGFEIAHDGLEIAL
jgi:pyrroloquinoline quinone biosynthesis protein B